MVELRSTGEYESLPCFLRLVQSVKSSVFVQLSAPVQDRFEDHIELSMRRVQLLTLERRLESAIQLEYGVDAPELGDLGNGELETPGFCLCRVSCHPCPKSDVGEHSTHSLSHDI